MLLHGGTACTEVETGTLNLQLVKSNPCLISSNVGDCVRVSPRINKWYCFVVCEVEQSVRIYKGLCISACRLEGVDEGKAD